MKDKSKPTLKIIGEDGNGFHILGKARKVAKEHGLNWDAISKEATSGDYSHLLTVMMEYFDVR